MTLDEFVKRRQGINATSPSEWAHDATRLAMEAVACILAEPKRETGSLSQSERDAARATEAALIKQLQAVVRERDEANKSLEYWRDAFEKLDKDMDSIFEALGFNSYAENEGDWPFTAQQAISSITKLKRTRDVTNKLQTDLTAALCRADRSETALRGQSAVLEDKIETIGRLSAERFSDQDGDVLLQRIAKSLWPEAGLDANASIGDCVRKIHRLVGADARMHAANEESAKLSVSLEEKEELCNSRLKEIFAFERALAVVDLPGSADGVLELVRQRDEARKTVFELTEERNNRLIKFFETSSDRVNATLAYAEARDLEEAERDRCCRVLEESKDLAVGVGKNCAAIIRASVPS